MPPSLPIRSVQYVLCNTIAVQPLRANLTQQNILFVELYDAPVQTVRVSTAHCAQQCTADKERFEDDSACKDRAAAAQKCIFP